jgi:hypothetical protein
MAATEFCAHAFSTEEQLTQAQIYNQKPEAQYNEKQTRPKRRGDLEKGSARAPETAPIA